MKNIFSFSFFFLCAANVFAQKQTFDITTFTPPKGWKKQAAESAIQFSKENTAKGTYCLITLYKSVPGTANAKENFDLAWETLVKEMVTVSTLAEMQPAAIEDGWEAQSGYAPFEGEGSKGIVVLVTSSGFQKIVNIIILTNTDVYEKDIADFLGSVSLKKLKTIPQQTSITNNNKNSISGTWGKGNSATLAGGSFGRWSYTKEQYIFNQSGAYSFTRKVYVEYDKEKLLTRETGTYTISGNKIIINLTTNVIEA